MGRLRVRRPPAETFDLLLNLTNRHIHAQLVDRLRARVIVAVHTTEPTVRKAISGEEAPQGSYATGSVAAARHVGNEFGRRAIERGIGMVYWRQPGRYHGKIKAFIDAVRGCGVETKTPPRWDMPPAPEVDN